MKKRLLLLFSFATIISSPIKAEITDSFKNRQTEHFVIHYQNKEKIILQKTTAMLEKNYDRLTKYFSFKTKSKYNVYLISSADHFNHFFPNSNYDMLNGIANTKNRTMFVKTPSILNMGILEYEKVLAHELCHLMISDITDNRAPRWLHEGLAMHIEPIWYRDNFESLVLPKAYLSKQIMDFSALTYSFPPTKELIQIAYVQSRDFVVFLIKNHGKENLINLLNNLQNTPDLNSALILTYNQTIFDLQISWSLDLKKRYNWIYLYIKAGFFWFIISLIAVIGYFIITSKRKKALNVLATNDIDDENVEHPVNDNTD